MGKLKGSLADIILQCIFLNAVHDGNFLHILSYLSTSCILGTKKAVKVAACFLGPAPNGQAMI